MAIPLQTAALLADENRRSPFSGRLLQLGRQSLFFDSAAWERFCAGWSLPRPVGRADDFSFFQALGFDEVESLDVVADEMPTYVADLNRPLPKEWAGRFDCVYDGGTIEHVFNVAQSLKSVVRLLKVGGRAIHVAVMSNYIDHGFYQFSPTLFWDFYTANGFAVERMYLADLLVSGSLEFLHPWRLFRYTPGSCDHFNSGAWGFSPWPAIVWCVARKVEDRPEIVAPRQSLYSRWSAAGPASAAPPRRPGRALLRDWLRPVYLRMVKLKRLLVTPRPPCVGTVDAAGWIRWNAPAD